MSEHPVEVVPGRGGEKLDLVELCRGYGIGTELLERCTDVDQLLSEVLREYERGLEDLPLDGLEEAAGPSTVQEARRLRGLLLLASHIAELKVQAADDERHRKERLAEVMHTLGVLSHKINNPLTALMGRAQILQARKGTDPAVVKSAEVISESAQRIADLVKELAIVVKQARQDVPEPATAPAPDPEKI